MAIQEEYQRYIRQIRVPEFGPEGQEKLSQARVLVVGAGALGCPTLQYLAAAGVGTIGIVDGDDVNLTNLHRQVLYTEADLGKPKVEVAAERLLQLNSSVEVQKFFTVVHKNNIKSLLSDFDIAIDCSDNFPTKFLVNDACVMQGKPCIIGSAIQFSGQLSVYNYMGGPTYRCLLAEEPDPLRITSCSQAGVIGMVPGIIGSMQALEALKVITGIGKSLSGRLLQFDALSMNFNEFEVKLNPTNLEIKEFSDYSYSCPESELEKFSINPEEFLEKLKGKNEVLVVAFSDDGEPIGFQNYVWQTIPLYELPNRVAALPFDVDLVLLCEYGIKSNTALHYLVEKHNFIRVYNLKDGVASLRSKFQ
ncbi:MAG TPA: HesA/MoeB/ThiF family protein [Tenuifilaceae bacterium]|nr:HesA/MoeB/ThiF family protein [Tenuifilaceae bacterium]HPQ33828.1 HesA/MoeB/ThiF family protein [Tenuifilaceae bacterium]